MGRKQRQEAKDKKQVENRRKNNIKGVNRKRVETVNLKQQKKANRKENKLSMDSKGNGRERAGITYSHGFTGRNIRERLTLSESKTN